MPPKLHKPNTSLSLNTKTSHDKQNDDDDDDDDDDDNNNNGECSGEHGEVVAYSGDVGYDKNLKTKQIRMVELRVGIPCIRRKS